MIAWSKNQSAMKTYVDDGIDGGRTGAVEATVGAPNLSRALL